MKYLLLFFTINALEAKADCVAPIDSSKVSGGLRDVLCVPTDRSISLTYELNYRCTDAGNAGQKLGLTVARTFDMNFKLSFLDRGEPISSSNGCVLFELGTVYGFLDQRSFLLMHQEKNTRVLAGQ